MSEKLEIAGRVFGSRLIFGTGGFRSLDVLGEALRASGAEMATVAMRRVDPASRGSVLDVIGTAGVEVLPNTAGCYTARDAVLTARLAREALGTSWIKLEVIGDDRTLLPDGAELVTAARQPCRKTKTTIMTSTNASQNVMPISRIPSTTARVVSITTV